MAIDDATTPFATMVHCGSQVLLRGAKPLGRPPAPAVKGVRDKQSNDCQRQTKENKCHEGTDNHVQHRTPAIPEAREVRLRLEAEDT